jgi:hypothetical protein
MTSGNQVVFVDLNIFNQDSQMMWFCVSGDEYQDLVSKAVVQFHGS